MCLSRTRTWSVVFAYARLDRMSQSESQGARGGPFVAYELAGCTGR
jgi:hypothetical protein